MSGLGRWMWLSPLLMVAESACLALWVGGGSRWWIAGGVYVLGVWVTLHLEHVDRKHA